MKTYSMKADVRFEFDPRSEIDELASEKLVELEMLIEGIGEIKVIPKPGTDHVVRVRVSRQRLPDYMVDALEECVDQLAHLAYQGCVIEYEADGEKGVLTAGPCSKEQIAAHFEQTFGIPVVQVEHQRGSQSASAMAFA